MLCENASLTLPSSCRHARSPERWIWSYVFYAIRGLKSPKGEMGFPQSFLEQKEKRKGKKRKRYRKGTEQNRAEVEPRVTVPAGPHYLCAPTKVPVHPAQTALPWARSKRSPKSPSPLLPPQVTDLRRQRAGPTSEARPLDTRAASARPCTPVAGGWAPRLTDGQSD